MTTKNISELFQETSKYNDIDISFAINPVTRDINRLSDSNSIKQSVANLLRLRFYDIQFHPEIGSKVSGMLFELASSDGLSSLAGYLQTYLGNYEPRIQVKSLNVDTTQIDSNSISINIQYIIVGRVQSISQTVSMDRVR